MKRWTAWVLSLILCVTPALAYAQPVATETLLAQLLVNLIGQMESPSFALALEMGEDILDTSLSLDEQDIPDFTFGVRSGGEELRMDIDQQGLRYQSGEQRVAVALDTLIRLLTEEAGSEIMIPDVREKDVQLLYQIAFELLNASMACISTEVIDSGEAQLSETGEQTFKTRVTVDINALLAALDKAIPAALNRYADPLNALVERNRDVIYAVLNGELGEMREIAQNWSGGYLVNWIPEGTKALIVLEMQDADWTLTGQYGEAEIVRLVWESDRLYGAFGPGGQYAFDSGDLLILAQMADDVWDYVSEEAFTWRLKKMDNSMTAHLKLDSERLFEDLSEGALSVMREKRMEIEYLLTRYTPWMTLAGMWYAEDLNWESVYHTFGEELRIAINQYSSTLKWKMFREPLLRQIFGQNSLKLEMDLYAQNRYGGRPEIIWNFAAPCLNAELLVSGSLVNGSYSVTSSGMKAKYGYITGNVSESGANLVIGHQTKDETDMRLTIDAKPENGGWTALVYDMDGAETAKLTGSETGWNLMINKGKDTGFVQWYAYDGVYRGKIYNNGEELSVLFAEERDGGILRITHRKGFSGISKELMLRAGQESLSFHAGTIYDGMMMSGVDLDMQWSDQIPRLNGVFHGSDSQITAAYLPGQMDLSMEGTEHEWKIRIADLTAQNMDGNETRVDMKSVRTVDEETQFSESGWTIRTQMENSRWISRIVSDEGEKMTLTLDFAAQPKEQDLTGYIWLTEDQARKMLSGEMTEETPAPAAAQEPQLLVSKTYDVNGFQGMRVAVEIDKDGRIMSVNVIEHRETPGFGADLIQSGVLETLIGKEIEQAQIDCKSGVTMTSNAINEALKMAADDYIQEKQTDTSNSQDNPETKGYVLLTVGGQQYGDPIEMDREKIITIKQDDTRINRVHITPESVWMESSTCPNQDCIEQGEVHIDTYMKRILGKYIICLPNNVSVELVADE